jgi:predicted Zn-dependent peptidase
MKNRSIAPALGELQEIKLLQPEITRTTSGLPIHILRNVPNDIFHVQIEFGAGKMQQTKPLESAFTSSLLFSGTNKYTQLQIQELFDLNGAFVNAESSLNKTVVHVYGINERFEAIFDVIGEVLQNANYPESQFVLHCKSALQSHRINLEKNAYLARKNFIEGLYPNHVIGRTAEVSDFEQISRQDCQQFFENHLQSNIEQINVVGNLAQSHLGQLSTLFDKQHKSASNFVDLEFLMNPINSYIEKPKAMQSAIRIGKVLFTPRHEDYFAFDILETIFGGYFGSRLMQNLREDKGYTYGIGSGVTIHEQTGYFFISTEVGKQHKDAAMDAIAFEMNRLHAELIGTDELELVRAYIQGQLLKSSDGAFAQMNQFLFAKRFGLTGNYVNDYLQLVNTITPEKLRTLAQKYLNWDEMTKVVVG